jgi:glycosyltransferase involved in cell wall biosynthesis
MSHAKISAVLIARDEEQNIEAAIASLKFASQIVVADTGSCDRTMELAAKAGAEVHKIEFLGFSDAKSKALEFCRYELIFSMDADERVSPELAASIIRAAEKGGADAYSVCRLTYFLGRPIKHSGWYPEYVTRLFTRGKAEFNGRYVHESIKVDGDVEKLNGILHHYSYRDIESYIRKMDVYSTMSASEMHISGRKASILNLIFNPIWIFLKMFIFRAGFLDGFHGFLLAVLSSFHVFIKYSKLLQLRGRVEK